MGIGGPGVTGVIKPGMTAAQMSNIAGPVQGLIGNQWQLPTGGMAGLPPQLGGSSTLQDAINYTQGLPTGTSMAPKI